MAQTFREYNAPATYSFTFPSYQSSDVKVRVDGDLKTAGTHYNITGYTTTGGGTVVFIDNSGSGGTNHVPSSGVVRIYRDTSVDVAKATYTAGSSVKAADLNNNNTQLLYRAQEEQVPNLIQSYDIAASGIETSNIKDANITTAKIANGAVDSGKLADDAVITAKIADNAVTMAKLNSGALPTDITVASANIVNGTIVEADLSNSAITANKIADGTVGTLELSNGAVTRDKIAADAIDSTKLADNAVDSEHYTDGSIDRVHLEADIIDSTKLADNAVNSEHYVDGSIDREHLEADIIDSTKLADNAVGSEHIQTNAVTDSEIATGTLDNRYFTETELTNGALDGRYFTETESDARYFNISSGETITSGDTFPDNDNTIATTKAINARIIDIVNDVGGFDIVESEQHFPNTNPQGQAGSAAVLSIKAASTNLVPSGTTLTIVNGNLANNANITITGVTSTIPSGFGFIVESTSTLHSYTFHRLVPKATEVTTVAGNITNINAAANNESNINAAVSNASNINAAVSNASNINAAVSNASNINAAVSNASNINSAVSNASNITTTASNITNVNNVGNNVTNVNSVSNSAGANQTFTVTVQNVSGNKYFIDGVQTPVLKLARGKTYTFDMSDSSNSGHPLAFRDSSDNSYTTGVTTSGTAGSSGATVVIVVAANAPSSLKYYCTSHGNAMGNTINVIDDNVGTVAGSISNVNTVGGAIANVNTTAGSISNVNTVASNINSVNSFFNVYRTGANNPTTSLDTGDLFFNTTSNSLKVYTGSAWVDGVTATGNFAVVTGNTFTGSNVHNDNVKSLYGTGSDLEIYHNGTNSIIDNINTGAALQLKSPLQLKIKTNQFVVKNSADTESLIYAAENNKVNLYYDNAVKLETTSYGVLSNQAFKTEGDYIVIDNSGDSSYRLTRNGSALFTIRNNNVHSVHVNTQNSATLAFGVSTQNIHAGSIEQQLRIHGSTRNIQIPNDTSKLQIGASQDLEIYHDGSHSFIRDTGTGALQLSGNRITMRNGDAASEYMFTADENGAVELYYDNSKKFETTSGGVHVLGTLEGDNLKASNPGNNALLIQNPSNGIIGFGANNQTNQVIITTDGHLGIPTDTGRLRFGAAEDLQIYHDGSNSYITNSGTGNLYIDGDTDDLVLQAGDDVRIQTQGNEDAIQCIGNGAVELYYDNSKKFETRSDGAKVTGVLTTSSNIRVSGEIDLGTTNGNKFMDACLGDNYTFFLRSTSGEGANHENLAKFTRNGSVELFHDANLKLSTTSSGISVTGTVAATSYTGDGSNLSGINTDLVSDTSPQLGGDLDTNSFHINLDDDHAVRFGNSNDLQIYHNNSANTNEFTSALSTNFRGKNLYFYTNHNNSSESAIMCYANQGVELYYNNSKKFETTSTGVALTGNLELGDDERVVFGNAGTSDSHIRWDANHLHLGATGSGVRMSCPGLQINNYAGTETQLKTFENGAVELYYDNAKKFATYGNGVRLGAITNTLLWPAFANTSASRSWGFIGEDGAYGKFELKYSNGNDETLDEVSSRFYANGEVQLLYDNSLKFRTLSTGAQIYSGDLRFVNSDWAGESVKIQQHSNFLYIQGGSSGHIFRRSNGSNCWVVESGGHFRPAANNTYDIGTTSMRVRNIYTNDLHLSNEGSSNDVDGTWGDWTMQEGESDLFLKNNRSGKKYKFNLTEVS